MTNQFEKRYEIMDAKGTIFKGRLDEMVYIWNINYLADFALKRIYGHFNRDPKLVIKEWEGDLRLVQILDYMNYKEGKHTEDGSNWVNIG